MVKRLTISLTDWLEKRLQMGRRASPLQAPRTIQKRFDAASFVSYAGILLAQFYRSTGLSGQKIMRHARPHRRRAAQR